ncbi:MAG TPA: 4'-phosphopantetheinyl transferase superfamily protein [Rhodocyclaceae bacterium]|jgi:4'-phosphopantetheinyl transferase
METPSLAIHHWPEDGVAPLWHQGLLVAAITTPNTQDRTQARRLVRSALVELLAAKLGCDRADIQLIDQPGQAVRLALPRDKGKSLGVSISHEPGLSLLAINLHGPIGIDLMQCPEAPPWQTEIPQLARDYLGPDIARELANLPPQAQALLFAKYWTQQEARLKCLGLGLEEWSVARQQQFARLENYALALPAGYQGTVVAPCKAA